MSDVFSYLAEPAVADWQELARQAEAPRAEVRSSEALTFLLRLFRHFLALRRSPRRLHRLLLLRRLHRLLLRVASGR